MRDVIDTLGTREIEVQDQDGLWYSLRVRPYTTGGNKIDGAVLALLDIDALKRAERQADSALQFAEATIRAVRDPLLVLDGTLRVRTASAAFYETFRLAPHETEGNLIYRLGSGQWDIPALRELLENNPPEARRKDLLRIAVTGWGQEEDRRRSKEAGFDAHLIKPVDLAALNDLLRGDD